MGEEETDAHYDLAIAYKEMGLLDDAIRELEIVQRSGTRAVETLSLMAHCRLDLGQFEAAGADLGAALLAAAGLYQLTPTKDRCLEHCRSPAQFLARHWRAGPWGGFRLGLLHGGFCLGCCWFLMGLLFFGGVMNLYWIAGLALFVLLEKTTPAGHWLGRVTGGGLIAWGSYMIALAL